MLQEFGVPELNPSPNGRNFAATYLDLNLIIYNSTTLQHSSSMQLDAQIANTASSNPVVQHEVTHLLKEQAVALLLACASLLWRHLDCLQHLPAHAD